MGLMGVKSKRVKWIKWGYGLVIAHSTSGTSPLKTKHFAFSIAALCFVEPKITLFMIAVIGHSDLWRCNLKWAIG